MSKKIPETFRERVVEHLELLSSIEEQLKYQRDVPIANVPAELVCYWFDDLDMPNSLQSCGDEFTEDELNTLRSFHEAFDKVHIVKQDIHLNDLISSDDWKAFVFLAGTTLLCVSKV